MSQSALQIHPAEKFLANFDLPGDKSISHRALILSAISTEKSEITNLSRAKDVEHSQNCINQLGKNKLQLNCGNSATTMRLLAGLTAGLNCTTRLYGDESLHRRPMNRVAEPLIQMGAQMTLSEGKHPPIHIVGQPLSGITYDIPIASAQVKSALLLAGLIAEGETKLRGLIHTRDHTERLIRYFGGSLDIDNKAISINGGQRLNGAKLSIPGDLSAAAYWIAASTLIPNGQALFQHIGLNPTRMGFIKVLERMGAKITYEALREIPEPQGILSIHHAPLKGVTVRKEEIPTLIDELPILAIVATCAEGETIVCGAEELRGKESDRIDAISKNLNAMNIKIQTSHDEFRIQGPQKFRAATIDPMNDHRIAMAFSIAALLADGPSKILNSTCVDSSYPDFYTHLREAM